MARIRQAVMEAAQGRMRVSTDEGPVPPHIARMRITASRAVLAAAKRMGLRTTGP